MINNESILVAIIAVSIMIILVVITALSEVKKIYESVLFMKGYINEQIRGINEQIGIMSELLKMHGDAIVNLNSNLIREFVEEAANELGNDEVQKEN